MVMAMLGGAMIPVMFMPEIIQKFSVLSPITWAIRAIEGAIWREFSLVEMLLPCGILIGVGVVGITIGTFVLSRRN
jgi:ABC-2 type transport system permease protein